MTESKVHDIEKNIKDVFDKMIEYSETAQSELFLSYFHNSTAFLHIGSDGKMRNYEEFSGVGSEYYNGLKDQKIRTIRQLINVIDANNVILSWTGDIVAHFKSGDSMKLTNYSITNVFKMIDNNWKIIYSHESALPPEIIKKGK